jgi:hypothetical protein
VGARCPKVRKMVDWSAWKAALASDSDLWLRATVMSTMEPEEMSGGRRMEGNSICGRVRVSRGEVNCRDVVAPRGRVGQQALGRGGRGGRGGGGTYEALVFGEQHGDAGIDFADG